MNPFAGIGQFISGAAQNIGSGLRSFWNNIMAGPPSSVNANQSGDILNVFGQQVRQIVPESINPNESTFFGPAQTNPSGSEQLVQTPTGALNIAGVPSNASSRIRTSGGPGTIVPSTGGETLPSFNIGGLQFSPQLPGGSGNRAPIHPSPPQQINPPPPSKGSPGTPGTGEAFPGTMGSEPAIGQPGATGGGSAFLGAGAAGIGGGSEAGGTAGPAEGKQKQTQTTQHGAPQFIPWDMNNFESPEKIGLSSTTTPQGGTAWQDAQGNLYTQDAGGFHLRTSLPAGNQPTLSFNGKDYQLTPLPNIQTNLGEGRVWGIQNADGTTSYYVKTAQGFAPVVNPNLQAGQTQGELTGSIGAPNANISIAGQETQQTVGPAANPEQIPPSPETGAALYSAASGSAPSIPGAADAGAAAAGAAASSLGPEGPSFNAGPVSSAMDAATFGNNVNDLTASLLNGSMSETDFTKKLSLLAMKQQAAMQSQSGLDPNQNYNLSPSAVAGNDPSISHAIQSDPTGFTALNERFGVPQLQKTYLGQISTIGGITAAIAKMTSEIENDPNVPGFLAGRQIAYLAKKANELMQPITAQANTTKAQLNYATENMKNYYSNYWKQSSLGMKQFQLALGAGAVDPNDPQAIQNWANNLGMDPNGVQAIATYGKLASTLKLETSSTGVQAKQLSMQADSMALTFLNDPSKIDALGQFVINGGESPSQLFKNLSRSKFALPFSSTMQSWFAAHNANLSDLEAQFKAKQTYATTLESAPFILPIVYTKSVLKNMGELQTISNSIDRTNFPALNTPEFYGLLQAGNKNVVKYLTTVLEVSDLVAKILQGGGTGSGTSDTKLKQAQILFDTGFNKEQINGVVEALTPLFKTRVESLQEAQPTPLNFPNSNANGTGTGTGADVPTVDQGVINSFSM